MAFDWNEYIILAEKLIEGTPSEAQLRSATSRAYYGAFIQCRRRTPHAHVKDAIAHALVLDHYRRDGATRKEYSISSNLDGLRKKRNDADYNSFYEPKKPETENHIRLAKVTVKLLGELDSE